MMITGREWSCVLNNLKAKIKADKIREISLRYSMGEIRGSFNGILKNKPNSPKKKKWNEHEILIQKFWKIVFQGGSHKLLILREYAGIKLAGSAKKRKRKRIAFNKMYDSLAALRTALCWVCGKPAKHRHHIIQLQHGGTNSPRNVVTVCEDCHCEIHLWLKISASI